VLCGDEQDSVEQECDVEDVDGMVLLLTEDLPDDVEKAVWCCVDERSGAFGMSMIHRKLRRH
jgi:hypothetical protein